MILSDRQLQIVQAMCTQSNKSSKDIAFDIGITPGTYKQYISRIYEKLGLDNQRMLILWGIAHREELGIELPTIQEEAIKPS